MRVFASIIAIFLSATCFSAGKVALVVGVNQYQDEKISPLRFAESDANSISQVLTTNGWNVKTITTGGPKDKAPTSITLKRELQKLSKLSKLDSFLFYFSGHGFTSSSKVGYLALTDTKMGSLESTALSIPALIAAAESVDAANKSFFFDACRNIPGRSIGLETQKMSKSLFDSFRKLGEETSAAVFLSCKEGGYSF
jgi:uncharacterized caspase-like protein